jgi:hypothetical protein
MKNDWVLWYERGPKLDKSEPGVIQSPVFYGTGYIPCTR